VSDGGARGAADAPPAETPDAAADRRRVERRGEPRLAELSLPEVRRIVVTTTLFVAVVGLFLWMVRAVLVAGLLGLATAAYLRPLYRRLAARLHSPTLGALATLALVVGPVLAALGYSYAELVGVVGYVRDNETEVATKVADALARLGLVELIGAPDGPMEAARRWVVSLAAYGAAVPGAARAAVARGAVAASVFLFTIVYILTNAAAVGRYVRGTVSPRYAPLAGALERNVRGVLAGTLYGTVLTQAIKSAIVLALNVAFDVPLAGLLAVLSFVLGFFPIVGSWSVYVPVAAWLFVFRNAPGAALVVLGVGFLVNTVFVSMYLRPKLAAERSRVLNFYWMFVGLVTGVYALGLPGLVLGPALIAMLKTVVDTVREPAVWPVEPSDDGDAAATGALA
jgi:predicted PurR-regulated permease PerM